MSVFLWNSITFSREEFSIYPRCPKPGRHAYIVGEAGARSEAGWVCGQHNMKPYKILMDNVISADVIVQQDRLYRTGSCIQLNSSVYLTLGPSGEYLDYLLSSLCGRSFQAQGVRGLWKDVDTACGEIRW